MKNFIKGTRYIVMLIILISFCSGCENNKAMTDESNEVKANKSSDDLRKDDTQKKDTDLNSKGQGNDKQKASKSSEETSSKDDSKQSEADELKKDNSNLKKLTMIMRGEEPESYKEIAEMIEQKSGIDVKLDLQWYPSKEYKLQFLTAIQTDNIDIYPHGLSDTRFYKKSDDYADLTEALPKYAPKIYDEMVQSGELKAYEHEGKIVLLPDMYKEKNCLAVDFKNEYVKKYAIDSITTFEDYVKIITEINQEEGIETGYIYSSYSLILHYIACVYDYVILDENYGLLYKWEDNNMKIVAIEDVPEFTDTVLMINELYRKGILKLNQPPMERGVSGIYKVDTAKTGFEEQFWSNASVMATVAEDRTRFVLYPNKTIQRTSPVSGGMVMHKNSDVIKESLQLLDWVHINQENYDLFNYGTKNTHYKLAGEKVEIIKDNFIHRLFLNNKYIRSTVGGLYGDDNENIPDSQYPPHQGFVPECPGYVRGDLIKKNIISEMVNGQCNKQKLQDAIVKIKEKGATNTVISKYQKQLDAWRVSNSN